MAANLFDLSCKVALITGGNSGIGIGFGEGAIKHGASVCLWGTNPEKNASAVATLKTRGARPRTPETWGHPSAR